LSFEEIYWVSLWNFICPQTAFAFPADSSVAGIGNQRVNCSTVHTIGVVKNGVFSLYDSDDDDDDDDVDDF
jgi:hypothetical protein